MSDTKWPGMVSLKNVKTEEVKHFFPIDARDLLRQQPDTYVMVEDGTVEANRMNKAPFEEAVKLGQSEKKAAKAEPAKAEPAKAEAKAETAKA